MENEKMETLRPAGLGASLSFTMEEKDVPSGLENSGV